MLGVELSFILRQKTGCYSNHFWPLSFLLETHELVLCVPSSQYRQFMTRL